MVLFASWSCIPLRAQYHKNYAPNSSMGELVDAASSMDHDATTFTLGLTDKGEAIVMKTDPNGDLVWEKKYVPDLSSLSVGGFAQLTSSEFSRISFRETHVAGEHYYVGCMEFGYFDYPNGNTSARTQWYRGIYLMAVDEDGDLIWSRAFKSPNAGSPADLPLGLEPADMVVLPSDEILITGRYQPNSDPKSSVPFLLKLYQNSQLDWFKTYPCSGGTFMHATGVAGSALSKFIIQGNSALPSGTGLQSYGQEAFAIQTDFNGDPIDGNRYNLNIPGNYNIDATAVLEIDLLSYAGFATYTPEMGGLDKRTLIWSYSAFGGAVNWSNFYAEQDQPLCTPEYAHYGAGQLQVGGENRSANTFWLLSINSIGVPIWSNNYYAPLNQTWDMTKTYGDPGNLFSPDIKVLTGLVSDSQSPASFELIQADPVGEVGGCELGGNPEYSFANLKRDVIEEIDIQGDVEVHNIPEVAITEVSFLETSRCCELEVPLTLDLPGPICLNGGTVKLSGNPSSGWWQGAADANGVVNPTALGVGDHLVEYCVNNMECCVDCQTATITVVDCQTVDPCGVSVVTPPVTQLCAGTVSLSGSPAGGTWYGPALTGNVVDLSQLPPGDQQYTYCFTSGSCTDCKTVTLTTVATCSPQSCGVIIPAAINVTPCDPPSSIGASPSGGTWYGPNQLNGTVYPQFLEPGSFVLTYCHEDASGCIACGDVTVNVSDCDQCPGIEIFSTGPVGQNDPPFSPGVSRPGGTWYGPNNFNGSLDPSLYAPGTYRFYYCFEDVAEGWCCCTYTDITIGGEEFGKHGDAQAESSLESLVDFQVFPNPAKERALVAGIPAGTPVSVKNTLGQLVLEGISDTDGRVILNLNDLEDGVYFVSAIIHQERVTKKVVVER